MQAIICDIDGTLADTTHRIGHVTGGKHDWDLFFAEMDKDPIVESIRQLVLVLSQHNKIILCSGRPEEYRVITSSWLQKYGVPFDKLYMRPDGDRRSDRVIKAEMLEQILAAGYGPWLAIDDRPSIVALWRERGITCLQCRDWDERAPIASGLLTIMVGPSGAGKSTWLRSSAAMDLGIKPSHIISSDQVREDLCGDFKDQTRNEEVFKALHAIVKARIANSLPCVVDSTALRDKDRKGLVALASDGPTRYIIIDRSMEDKYRDAGWRAELGFDLIKRHADTFNSNLRNILAGDNLSNVTVLDLRGTNEAPCT